MHKSNKRKCFNCKAEPEGYGKKYCKLNIKVENVYTIFGAGYEYRPLQKCFKPLSKKEFNYLFLEKGDLVNYNGENGVVKKINIKIVWVVFKCNNDWENYRNYTGESVKIEEIKKGWKE